MGPSQKMSLQELPFNLRHNILKSKVVLIANWVQKFGTKYKQGTVICIGDDDNVPRFGLIKYVVIDGEEIFFLFHELDIIKFNVHFHAYECANTYYDELDVIKIDYLLTPLPMSIIREHGKSFIVLRHSL